MEIKDSTVLFQGLTSPEPQGIAVGSKIFSDYRPLIVSYLPEILFLTNILFFIINTFLGPLPKI